MLKSLDILIGFSLAMLIASMAVTVLTQICSSLLNSRGTHLRDGLVNLLNQLHSALPPETARTIVEHVLRHPLLREGEKRLGGFIHRDELIRLLLDSASAEGAHRLPDIARHALVEALARNGVEDPAAALQKIRELALSLEASSPALANAARHDLAILKALSSEFVAKTNEWFDRTMDRVSVRFTMTTRRITLINSFLVAVAIQMDAVSLVNRLASNDALRSSLTEKAYAADKLGVIDTRQLTALASRDVFPVPVNPMDWVARWHFSTLPGVAISILLLSLGAPFWFEALKNMLRLRGLVAGRDEGKRSGRR